MVDISEKQLASHEEKHGQFPCEKCDKTFSFEVLLEKHITAVHGKMKIYCPVSIKPFIWLGCSMQPLSI